MFAKTLLLLSQLCRGWFSWRGLSNRDIMKVGTFGVWSARVGGFPLWWGHRRVIFELRTRVGASVGILGLITRQRKGNKGDQQCKTQWNYLHNRNCTIIPRMFNPIQWLGRGLFIPTTLLQHSKNAPPVFPEVKRLQ